MTPGPITSWEIDGETVETVSDFIFWHSKITADGDCSHEIKRCLLLGRKVMTNLDSILKSRDVANKGPSSQGYGFSIGHVWMWELDCEEGWAPKTWCFWMMVLEKTPLFFFFAVLFFILFFNFTILYWFCHISKWSYHRYTCVPHPEPFSLLPPHTIPLGRSSVWTHDFSKSSWEYCSSVWYYFNNIFSEIKKIMIVFFHW